MKVVLHDGDLAGLFLDGQILVDDTDTAVQGHGNGHAGFGHRVHGRAEKGDVDADPGRETAGNIRVFGEKIRVSRYE